MNGQAIKTIESILKRGNDVQIQRRKDGYIILEVKREIKYTAPSERTCG